MDGSAYCADARISTRGKQERRRVAGLERGATMLYTNLHQNKAANNMGFYSVDKFSREVLRVRRQLERVIREFGNVRVAAYGVKV